MLNGIIIISIITILIQSIIPFLKKEILKEMDIIVFMLIINIIIFIILIVSCVYKYTLDDFTNQINKLKNKKTLGLLLFLGVSLMLINFLKNYIYSNSNINQSETLLITLSIIFTILYGWLFFSEKVTLQIGLGVFVIIIGIFVLFKK